VKRPAAQEKPRAAGCAQFYARRQNMFLFFVIKGMANPKPITTPEEFANVAEADVRAWRDKVYGAPIQDKGWLACRDHWMRPSSIQWLKSKADLPLKYD
jgi:hypothetical protein